MARVIPSDGPVAGTNGQVACRTPPRRYPVELMENVSYSRRISAGARPKFRSSRSSDIRSNDIREDVNDTRAPPRCVLLRVYFGKPRKRTFTRRRRITTRKISSDTPAESRGLAVNNSTSSSYCGPYTYVRTVNTRMSTYGIPISIALGFR